MTNSLILYVGVFSLFLMDRADAQIIEEQVNMENAKQSNTLACQLTGRALAQRLSQLKKEIFSKVEATQELEDGFAFQFPDDSVFVFKLVDYILAERSCCPFFEFDLNFSAQHQGVSLKISGPPGVKEMIGDFLK